MDHLKPSPHTPADWRFVLLIEERGKFSVRLPVTYSQPGKLACLCAGLVSSAENLPLEKALEAGAMLEKWRLKQEEKPAKRGRK